MTIFSMVWWAVWWAMLIVGDPILNAIGGEKLTDTHYIAYYVPYGLRIAGLAWLIYHLLIQHVRS